MISWRSRRRTLLPEAYLLCTMPRSGSTLLCDLLRQTGVAGAPNSFFRAQSMANFAQEWGIAAQELDSFDRQYLETAIHHGTNDTGCFGLRIMWNNMPDLITRLADHCPDAKDDVAILEAPFGRLKFIHLTRQDKVAEAVSLAMAHQTGLWHRNADGTELERMAPPADPVYDKELIMREYKTVTRGDALWHDWFSTNTIRPLRVTYEDLSADPLGQLARILIFLGRDPVAAEGITPGTAKLATPLSAEWAARFRRDAGIASTTAPT